MGSQLIRFLYTSTRQSSSLPGAFFPISAYLHHIMLHPNIHLQNVSHRLRCTHQLPIPGPGKFLSQKCAHRVLTQNLKHRRILLIKQRLQFCADHYREELTVESVAESLGVSRSCVSHIFSCRIGVNFREYINSLRLTEAETLLGNRNYTVTEVANMTGFPTIRTFNRAFRKKHGLSPLAYRKAWKA